MTCNHKHEPHMTGQINNNQMLKIHYRKQCEISTEVKQHYLF
jgi:hypothetical protein